MLTRMLLALVGSVAVVTAFQDFGQKLEIAEEWCAQQSDLSSCDGFICRLLFEDGDAYSSQQTEMLAPYKRGGVSNPQLHRPGPAKGFMRFGRKRRSITSAMEADKRGPNVKSFIRFGRAGGESPYWPSQDRADDRCARMETLLIKFLEAKVEQKPSILDPESLK